MSSCEVASCPNSSDTRGYCRTHYARLQRLGDVFADQPIGQFRFAATPAPYVVANKHIGRGYKQHVYCQMCGGHDQARPMFGCVDHDVVGANWAAA